MPLDHPPNHLLVVQFVADVLQHTRDCPTPEAHVQALQDFLAPLTAWLLPEDQPLLVDQPFPLFRHLVFTPAETGDDETISVAFSPGGTAVFRAWCRRRGVDPLLSSS